jgi:predicted DNA-binding transcriptional regulator AlpA
MDTQELLKKVYLDEKEVSALTGFAVPTLRNQRFRREGLPYLKVGKRSVRYRTADVLRTMDKNRISFDE